MMEIKNHKLSNAEQMETPNTSGEFASGGPDTIVIHFTAGRSAESSAKYLCRSNAKASAHLVIGRDGKIYQLAPFNIITWHAGRSTWKKRTGLNKFSIGIELDNAGELTENGSGEFFTWFNKLIGKEEAFYGKHRNRSKPSFWHAYTEEQIDTAFEVCRLLVDHYNINEIVGHEEISPKRKSDPGPAFPLDRMRQDIFHGGRDSEQGAEFSMTDDFDSIVNASKLNIRTGPGVQFGIAGPPLVNGTTVRELRTRDGWTEIEISKKAWVSSKFLKPLK